jgi:hypothetical protein
MIVESGTQLISCDHCSIVALDTPRFGWKRWTESVIACDTFYEDVMRHHCPAAAQLNEYIEAGLVHMVAPEEAVQYEDWTEADEAVLSVPSTAGQPDDDGLDRGEGSEAGRDGGAVAVARKVEGDNSVQDTSTTGGCAEGTPGDEPA